MSREYTTEEVREKFLKHVINLTTCWNGVKERTCLEKLEGLAFSMLVLLDGGTELPGFIVAPAPHEDDKEYLKKQNENWFPENNKPSINCNIAGYLHELFPDLNREEKRNA